MHTGVLTTKQNAMAHAGEPRSAAARAVRVRLTFVEFKAFAADVARIKAKLHRALKGRHDAVIELPEHVTLQLQVDKTKYFGRRKSEDTPPVTRCPPEAENAKLQAQRALQTTHVKQAFHSAFPGNAMNEALDVLCDMMTEKPAFHIQPNLGIPNNKKTRLVALLKSRPPHATARALDALWACLMYTQRPLHLEDADYDKRRAYFTRIRELVQHTPPRLEGIEPFVTLYTRVHGQDPPAGPSTGI